MLVLPMNEGGVLMMISYGPTRSEKLLHVTEAEEAVSSGTELLNDPVTFTVPCGGWNVPRKLVPNALIVPLAWDIVFVAGENPAQETVCGSDRLCTDR